LILQGKPVAEKVLGQVRDGVARLQQERGITPGLAVILVGSDPASAVYVRGKKNTAASVGIASPDYVYPEGLTQRALLELIDRLNADPSVHGILVQLPLPKGLDEDEVVRRIDPDKDVDGLTPANLGQLLAGNPRVVPCTPAGCIEVLDHYGATLQGAEAVVVGRSRLVGKPLAQLLLARHATVTMCHTRTRDLTFHTRRADILCVAAGRPRMITGEMVKPGAWVIDVGVNRLDTGKLAGDVDFATVEPIAHAVTPVPGGIGPMTIAMLMKNTLECARRGAFSSEGAATAPSETSPRSGLRGQSPRSNTADTAR
jgi:methylenetetrahydrofolate dehydrogenase (NADP+)/methenyltetrahydrofolate cyclohydrolase